VSASSFVCALLGSGRLIIIIKLIKRTILLTKSNQWRCTNNILKQ